jgi:antitoxin component of MazEF toxin-antitoxin module
MQTKKKLVLVSNRSGLNLDADLLALIHVEPGGEVTLEVDDGRLIIEHPKAAARRAQAAESQPPTALMAACREVIAG